MSRSPADDNKTKDRVPLWMRKFGIVEGEWLNTSKVALRAGMTPRFELKPRVFFCGLLASHGYQGEAAWTMAHGKRIPLTPAHVARQLHKEALAYYAEAGIELSEEQKLQQRPSRQHIRRAIEELEEEGVCERRTEQGIRIRDLPLDDRRRLQSGRLRLFFFARPLPARNVTVKDVAKNGYIRFEGLSAKESRTIASVLSRQGVSLPAEVANNGYIAAEAKVALVDYLKASEVAEKALADRVSVALSRERIETSTEMGRTENNNNNGGPPLAAPPEAPLSVVVVVDEREVQEVYEGLSRFGTTTMKGARKLLDSCRIAKPGVSTAEIVDTFAEFRIGRNTENAVGLLITETPEKLKAPRHANPVRVDSEEQRRTREHRYVLEHPDEFDEEQVQASAEYLRTVAAVAHGGD